MIYISYKAQSLEEAIGEFERETLDLLDNVLSLYDDLQEANANELMRSLKIPEQDFKTRLVVWSFFNAIRENFNKMADQPLANKAKAYFSNGRLYRCMQALAHFRLKYYTQLTTSDYDLDFTVTALKELFAIQKFFHKSNSDFGSIHDQIVAFLAEHSLLVADLESCFPGFTNDIKEITEDRAALCNLFKGFLQHSINSIFKAFILCVDMQARERGIDIQERDCFYIVNILKKMSVAPELVITLVDMMNHVESYSIAAGYKNQVIAFKKQAKLLRELDANHIAVGRCMPMSQCFNKAVIFNVGKCEGGAAILLHSDLSRFYNSPRIQKFDTYADIESLTITSDIFKRQRNQLSKRQTDQGDYFTQVITIITADLISNLLSTVYKLAHTVLQQSTDKEAKIMVHLLGDSGHAIAFKAYALQNGYIKFLFIDLNYGMYRFSLNAVDNTKVLQWFTSLFGDCKWVTNIKVMLHYSKSPTLREFLAGVKTLNTDNKALKILNRNMRAVNFAARYDDARRNKMYALLSAFQHGDDRYEIFAEILEQYKQIADKTLVDHLQGIYICTLAAGNCLDRKDYPDARLLIEHMASINEVHGNTLLYDVINLLAKITRAYINEKQQLGSGKQICEDLYSAKLSEGADAELLAILQTLTSQAGVSVTEFERNIQAILGHFQAKYYSQQKQLESYLTTGAVTDETTLILAIDTAIGCVQHAIVDDSYKETSLIAADKPNIRIVHTQRSLPVTWLFNQNPSYLQAFCLIQGDGEDYLLKQQPQRLRFLPNR